MEEIKTEEEVKRVCSGFGEANASNYGPNPSDPTNVYGPGAGAATATARIAAVAAGAAGAAAGGLQAGVTGTGIGGGMGSGQEHAAQIAAQISAQVGMVRIASGFVSVLGVYDGVPPAVHFWPSASRIIMLYAAVIHRSVREARVKALANLCILHAVLVVAESPILKP